MASAVPMETNPETMNKYLQKLGVPEKWHIVDVIALEGEPLVWIPRPVLAVILLFPLTDHYEEARIVEEQQLGSIKPPENLFYMKQVTNNICGTIALVHSIANNLHRIELADGFLKKYIEAAEKLDPASKGALLGTSMEILDAYRELVPPMNEGPHTDAVINHFVTFIHKDGKLYELDGRKEWPVEHGPTAPESLLEDAAAVCRKFIEREPDNIGFNIVALVSDNN